MNFYIVTLIPIFIFLIMQMASQALRGGKGSKHTAKASSTLPSIGAALARAASPVAATGRTFRNAAPTHVNLRPQRNQHPAPTIHESQVPAPAVPAPAVPAVVVTTQLQQDQQPPSGINF